MLSFNVPIKIYPEICHLSSDVNIKTKKWDPPPDVPGLRTIFHASPPWLHLHNFSQVPESRLVREELTVVFHVLQLHTVLAIDLLEELEAEGIQC